MTALRRAEVVVLLDAVAATLSADPTQRLATDSSLAVQPQEPQLAVQLRQNGQLTAQARLLPMVLGDRAAARAAPWRLAAALLEAAIGPAWRDLPLPFSAAVDLGVWRPMRRELVMTDESLGSRRLSDLLLAADVICGLQNAMHHADTTPLPLRLDDAAPGYQLPSHGWPQAYLDWRTALVQLTVDTVGGTPAASTAARLHTALRDALIAACRRAARAGSTSHLRICASAQLTDWADALHSTLTADGLSVSRSMI